MIQLLANRYKKGIAYLLLSAFYLGIVIPVQAITVSGNPVSIKSVPYTVDKPVIKNYSPVYGYSNTSAANNVAKKPSSVLLSAAKTSVKGNNSSFIQTYKPDIDGPSQPEMSSFKAAGTNDMVNLFSGDFSYNIPLLDVGGYPVNIFYNGGITMEEEASWVGLGWNINPGNVNRNMRGVPDDFNGTEKLIQKQNMKPNKTWGVSLGADIELVGIKSFEMFSGSLGASMGISVNNYLGPAIELGLKGTTSFKLGKAATPEKSAPGMSLGLNANLSSRSGLTLSPNVSLSGKLFKSNVGISTGVGLSTSYNSRSGIKSLQISGQMSASYDIVKGRNDEKNIRGTEENKSSMGAGILSSSISFSKPSYIPALRSVITSKSGAGRFQFGTAMFGFYGSLEVEGYGQVSKIAGPDQHVEKPMIGYLYSQNAKNNRNAVMDFTRINDNEVTPSSPIISVPQYAYDVFSIQGEGTGGSIRAYRNDLGYARDNYTTSRDEAWSAGVDVGIPGHVGANFNTVKTPTTIGEWENGNKLKYTSGFTENSKTDEAIYFRNPGESNVIDPAQFAQIGGTDLVRFKLGGTNSSPSIEPTLQRFSNTNNLLGEVSLTPPVSLQRKNRTQVISYLSANEARHIGLDTVIKSYYTGSGILNNGKLAYDTICRNCDERKGNHISQINVTEADGKRYVYGVPVYNLVQQDYTFTVANNCQDCDKVPFSNDDASLTSTHIGSGIGGKDGYTQISNTPPYAHSFLLSGLLSPDYVDVTSDGITEDDLGGAVKFNYTKYDNHKWRTPHVNGMEANSNPGHLTETKDDKGIISYGERESWYLNSVESKTMIALFTLADRNDGKGFTGPFSTINGSDLSLKRISKIDLYSKADLKKNGISLAKPIKTVHFEYDYSLCANTPDNTTGGQGKLTLKKIWFTYNGQREASSNKNQYVFSYTAAAAPVTGENPPYEFSGSDRWGNYKPFSANPDAMKNRDYPYSVQDKTTADQNARAWNLKRILLPSGGQIEVDYESDDYAFVQNKRAANMCGIIGFSNSQSSPVANLYNVNGNSVTENDYVFIKVPESCSNKTEVYQKYLQDFTQLAFKIAVNMPKGGYEYVPTYAVIKDYGVYTGAGFPAIWVQLKGVNDKGKTYSPLSVSAIEYLREQLPGQAFPGYDVSESSGLQQLEDMFNGWFTSIRSAFSRMPDFLRENNMAQSVLLNRSFVRLTNSTAYKYGGGQRVKTIRLRDNWNRMTNQYTSVYGQEYNYTTTEIFNGSSRTISSGVASYEPSIGGDENPFQSMIQISDEVPLGPTSFGAIEMPVLDAFFPAPSVGYSKVTVTSIGKKQNPDTLTKKTRSGVGKQVSEFYTAKDFPVFYNYTSLDASSDKRANITPSLAFFYKYAFDSRALSQGFLVATNDMHGKMKSQSSYAENDPNTRINYTENFYRNTGGKGFDEKFDFVYNSLGGEVKEGNMGIDIELMNDTREFSVKTNSFEIQGQVDWMLPPPFPLWLPFVWPVVSKSENTYRAVTTTKVINYHSVLDSVVVIDKGSQVSTKNLVYDAETGQVIVNRTNNEFDKAIYSVNYPAYWAYSGMGLAYKNIDAVYSGINFNDGKITAGMTPAEVKSVFESGDELYIIDAGSTAGCDAAMASPGGNGLVWALDTAKNSSSLTNTTPAFIFIDKTGKPYNRTGVKFRIVRSGHRNMLGAPLAGVTVMSNPVTTVALNTRKLVINNNSKVINASAVEYKEKWQTDNDVFRKYSTVTNPTTCEVSEVDDCNGYLEKKINPYRKGLLGNFRGYRNMVFYGERMESNPLAATNLPVNGYLKDFSLYWGFDGNNNLIPDNTVNSKWVWNSQSTRFNPKGLEVETKDALNIYTAAQYGYQKTMPVAIANNSRSHEMFFEGFEDNDYAETLNGSIYNPCTKKHIDFSGTGNAQIENTSLLGFNAHTGKSVLKINANSQAIKNISTASGIFDTYDNFSIQKDTTKSLINPGGNASNHLSSIGGPIMAPFAVPYISNLGMAYQFSVPTDQSTFNYELTANTSQYTEVNTAGTYSFSLNMNLANAQGQNSNATMVLTISDLNGNVVGYADLICSLIYGSYVCDGYQNITLFLCKGTYLIQTSFIETTDFWVTPGAISNYYLTDFSYTSNLNTVSYQSLTTSNCVYTKPIPASESMLNPTFSIPSNKKMVFSAWVRETCGNPQGGTPCTVSSYTNNEVQIDFGSTPTVLKPTGPIIEGWQRYEGYFTAPLGATNMQLRMVNNSGNPIYFDDIRIHPFNSNMKSYVYDPVNLRLTSELDANNYASFYEYDEEGTLIRTKVETKEGVKTVTESRSAKQKNITDF